MTPAEFESEVKKYSRYIRTVSSMALWAYKLPCTTAHIDDAVQETLMGVLRTLHLYREEASFKSHVYLVAHRVAGTMAKTARRRARLNPTEFDIENEFLLRAPKNPHAALAEKEFNTLLDAAIRSLNPVQQTSVRLKLAGYSDTQAAAIVGSPAGTERTRMFHAHKKLRKFAEEHT